MKRAELFETGKYSDFTFIDDDKNCIKAHRIVIAENKFFNAYLESGVGADTKSSINVPNINIVKPIVRFLYINHIDDSIRATVREFGPNDLIEFYQTIDMWDIDDMQSFVYDSIVSSLDLIASTTPDNLYVLIRIAEKLLPSRKYGNICLSVITKFNMQSVVPDEVLSKDVLPHMVRSKALEIVKTRKNPKLLATIFPVALKDQLEFITKNIRTIQGLLDDEGNPFIPHKILSEVICVPKRFHTSNKTLIKEFMKSRRHYHVRSMFNPVAIDKYQNIGTVIGRVMPEGMALRVKLLSFGGVLRIDDTIIPTANPDSDRLTITKITTVDGDELSQLYPGFEGIIYLPKNDLCMSNQISKVVDNWMG